jgi:hypothetical protein
MTLQRLAEILFFLRAEAKLDRSVAVLFLRLDLRRDQRTGHDHRRSGNDALVVEDLGHFSFRAEHEFHTMYRVRKIETPAMAGFEKLTIGPYADLGWQHYIRGGCDLQMTGCRSGRIGVFGTAQTGRAQPIFSVEKIGHAENPYAATPATSLTPAREDVPSPSSSCR